MASPPGCAMTAPGRVLEGGLEAWRAAGLPLVPAAKLPPRDAKGRTLWVTRSRPKIDRIACPWLIRRFVDPARGLPVRGAVRGAGVAERFAATPFDIEDVFWSHRGETLHLRRDGRGVRPRLEPLLRLATIVRGADTARLDLAPEAAGLLAASLGLSRMYADDLEQLEAGMVLYDAFYRWCRDATERDPQLADQRRPRPDRWTRLPLAAAAAGMHWRIRPSPRPTRVWLRVAALSFGGPAGQIAVMHRILVDEKRWIGERRFLHALNFCMLLPGPEAQQLATYIGWLLHGTRGGLVAGVLFVLPGLSPSWRSACSTRPSAHAPLVEALVLRAEGRGARDRRARRVVRIGRRGA